MTTVSTTVYLNHADGSFAGFDASSAALCPAGCFDLEVAGHLTGAALIEAAREVVFEQLNIDAPEAPWALRHRLAGHRSLSVGDVVVIGETAWAVAAFGWRPVPADALTAALSR